MKSLFIIQYYPYQYNQFKLLIDKLNCDVLYKVDTRNLNITGKDSSHTELYSLDHKVVPISELKSKGYDYLIYTGPCKQHMVRLAEEVTKYGWTIYLAHSLMGTIYDCQMATPWTKKSIGVLPFLWEDFDSYNHTLELLNKDKCGCRYVRSLSNPIVAEALSSSPSVTPEKDTLGVILGELSPFEQAVKVIKDNYRRLGIKKIKIKFHPLTNEYNKSFFYNSGLPIEYLPIDTNKYEFTDSCEYLLGGASSLLLESIMRAKYFHTNQKFMKLYIRRGIDINLPTMNKFNPEIADRYLSEFTLYDKMIDHPYLIISEYLSIIKELEQVITGELDHPATLSEVIATYDPNNSMPTIHNYFNNCEVDKCG